jgi:viroplasmin and RNaseH domain-containing protein
VFCDRKPGVYDLWRVCSEYVVGFSGAAFQIYLIRMQVEEAYVTFLKYQNEIRKSEQVTQKVEDVARKWC